MPLLMICWLTWIPCLAYRWLVTHWVNAGLVSPTRLPMASSWLTGKPLGIAGAGLATSLSIAFGVLLMWIYFHKLEKFVAIDRTLLGARVDVWKRILRIGLPPGGEFALMFCYLAIIYWVIRHFGAEAQAGFGVGSRVMQAIFLPAMAVAFAVAPIVGQNCISI